MNYLYIRSVQCRIVQKHSELRALTTDQCCQQTPGTRSNYAGILKLLKSIFYSSQNEDCLFIHTFYGLLIVLCQGPYLCCKYSIAKTKSSSTSVEESNDISKQIRRFLLELFLQWSDFFVGTWKTWGLNFCPTLEPFVNNCIGCQFVQRLDFCWRWNLLHLELFWSILVDCSTRILMLIS